MKYVIIALVAFAAMAFCADRVVLVEDFTNCGCGPCWSFEPTLNAFINPHLVAGDISVCRVHTNWPSASDPIYLANPTEQNARWSFYGVTGVPTVKVDGILNGYPGVEAAYNTRAAVPCYLAISVARDFTGDSSAGVISISLIAEQDLGAAAAMRVFAILVENDVAGAGYWSSSVFEQAFRDNLFGTVGPVVEFEAPYPDTVYFSVPYTLNPAWNYDNLYLVTFVQEYASAPNKEVMNSHFARFLELPTGIEDDLIAPASPDCMAMANPCAGAITMSVMLSDGMAGTIQVYDVTGREVANLPVLGTQTLSIPVVGTGVFYVRLTQEGGSSAVHSVVVLD
jgi:hypothetical protein